MKKIILFLFLLFPLVSIAQIDSIEYEIMNYENTRSEIISKGRRLMTDKLIMDDFQKMKAIKDYLLEKFADIENPVFLDQEYWLILYWTQEFDDLLSSIEKYIIVSENQEYNGSSNHTFHPEDQLLEQLVKKSNESKNLIEIIINNTGLSDEESDFLKLHLNYCLFSSGYTSLTQDSLNMLSDQFFFKYPSSTFRVFIKKVIQYKIKISDFGFGYDFFIGYGFFKGGISESLIDYAPFGFSIDLMVRNFDFNFGIGLGVTTLSKTIVYNNIRWEKDMKADIYFPTVSLGYNFNLNNRLSISPYAGVCNFYITPTYEDIQSYPQLEYISMHSNASPLFGIGFNYYSRPATFSVHRQRNLQFQGFIKLKYTYYQSGFNKDYYGLDGAMHTICMSFGGISRRIYRL
jgi:hypothetical protein